MTPILAIVTGLLTTLSVNADPLIAKFVAQNVKIEGCSYGLDTIRSALEEGLNRIAAINLALSDHIKQNTPKKILRIYCDVGPAPASIYYQPSDDSIHLRRVNVKGSHPSANFFHEFLHFYGLEHVADPRIVNEWDEFIYDPVYACHVTAFPQLAERLKIDTAVMTAAASSCARVKPVEKDLRGFKY